MGNHCEVAGAAATLTCESPGCNNAIAYEGRAMTIMTGHGEVMDFCNQTCLKAFMQERTR